MAAYRGVDPGSPFHAQGSSHVPSTTSEVSVDVTTTADTRLLVFAAARASSAGGTPEASLTERYDAYSNTRVLVHADEELSSAGTFERTVVVDDDGGASEAFAFAVALLPSGGDPGDPNVPPMVDPVANQTNEEGDPVDVQVTASDADVGDELTYEATNLPAGLSIGASDGRITGTIDTGAASGSPYAVIVSVDDDVNPPVEVTFSWTVTEPDDPGPIAYVGGSTFATPVDVVTSFDLDVPSGVADGDLLIMNMFHGGASNPVVTPPGGWTELYQERTSSEGVHSVFYKVAGPSEPASYTWQLSLPKFTAAGLSAYRGVHPTDPFHVQVSGQAADASELTLELTTTEEDALLLFFAAINAANAGGEPQEGMVERYDEFAVDRTALMAEEQLAAPGTFTRTIGVDDPAGADLIFGFAVALLPSGGDPGDPNVPPVVDPVADQTNEEGDPVDVQVTASDDDLGDELTYEATNLPAGLSIGASDGRITGTIDTGAASGSPYAVIVSVDDDVNPPVEVTFSWTVTEPDDPGPIAYVGGSTFATPVDVVTSFDLDVPPGVADGDLLIMNMFHGGASNPVVTPPGGWTELYQERTSSEGVHSVFYKVAGPSEPASYTWQLSLPKHPAAGLSAYRGVHPTDPFHVQVSGQAADASELTLELTTTEQDVLLLFFAAINAASAGGDPQAGMVERYDEFAFGRTALMAEEQLAAPGMFARTIGVDEPAGADRIFGLAVALLPSGGDPGDPNVAPVFDPVVDQVDLEGDAVDLQVTASDADVDDELTYAAVGLPPGLSIDASDGRITGTIDEGAAGESPYEVTVSVDDDVNPPVEAGFTWTITEPVGSIAFAGSETYSSGSQAITSFAVDVPSGVQSGDLLVMSMYHGASPNPTISAPDGWTQLHQDWTSSGGKHTVFYRFAGASEPGSYTWQLDLLKHIAAGMAAYRGVDAGSPFHAQGTAHAVNDSEISVEVTTTEAGTRLLVFAAARATSPGASPGLSLAERYDEFASSRVLVLSDEELSGADTAERTVAFDAAGGTTEAFAFAVALRPQGAALAARMGEDDAAAALSLSDLSEEIIPEDFRLGGNYPNPFNPSTTILIDLPEDAQVTIEVYDMLGRRVFTTPETFVAAGTDRGQRLDLGSLASGTYVYAIRARSESGQWRATGKLMLAK
jgi:hypothetical protein